MKIPKLLLTGAALAFTMNGMVSNAAAAEKEPSLYLQCDGQPNNTSAGETVARLIGAITLLGLFAPQPEAPDPKARKFGEEGVKICSQLIDGTESLNPEKNPVRRLELILGRALHHIEAKNYEAAIADTQLAQKEATEQGFMDDPYISSSFGRAFPRIEAEALLRMGKPKEAQQTLFDRIQTSKFSFFPVLTTPNYPEFLKDLSAGEEKLLDNKVRMYPALLSFKATRLDLAGRFDEASKTRESAVHYFKLLSPAKDSSILLARAALSHALNNDWDMADKRAAAASTNMHKLTNEGTPETDRTDTVELLDLYNILKLAHEGKMTEARRNFGARSQWLSPSFGAVMAVNSMLRKDAPQSELFGLLTKSSDELWDKQYADATAKTLAQDSDNKSLFAMIPPMNKASSYEAFSNNVWKTSKSKYLSKEKLNAKDDKRMAGYLLFDYYSDISPRYDAFILHSALMAQKNGHNSFVFIPLIDSSQAWVYFNEADDEAKHAEFSLNAEQVIAELSDIIPSPEALKIIKANRAKKK
ncbi:hypothetical protein LPB140_02440 [Sphingorhabdus lutea]|uniref:Tetratricopeptide repeat protein n=1 Tax=Sphingorhabdus lutea TaxID=1913578 RepID=A0A1L3J9S9_9SPHN|nr:hypothetical protein [Sphingorhabdus lutea]APG61871.1 hypothetical protein LPB140_02440 [Sphingorhabdus lutea]